MSASEAIVTCLRKAVSFRGRASRGEFWWFSAFAVAVTALAISTEIQFLRARIESGILSFLIGLVLLVPTVSATARRLQDTGRHGIYVLMPIFMVFVGIGLGTYIYDYLVVPEIVPTLIASVISAGATILFIYWLIQQSEPGQNRFGPNPFDPHLETD